MPQYRRVTTAMGVDVIAPHLLPDPDFPDNGVANWLKAILEHPDGRNQVVIVAAFADDRKTVIGFGICMAPLNQRHTFILQTWVNAKHKDAAGVPQVLMRFCKEWTIQKGRTYIKAESSRNPDALLRRWGFRQESVILRYDITDDTEPGEKATRKKNGRKQHSQAGQHPDAGAAVVGADAVQAVHQEGSRQGRDAGGRQVDGLRRKARRGHGAGVRAGQKSPR